MRFSRSVYDWTQRVLLRDAEGEGDRFSRVLLFCCGMGLLLGNGWCGLIWGAVTALLLNEHNDGICPHYVPKISDKPSAQSVSGRKSNSDVI